MIKKKFMILLTACVFSAGLVTGQTTDSRFRHLFDNAKELYNSRQYLPAQKEFEKAASFLNMENDAHAEELAYYLAACAARQGDADAEELLTLFLKRYPATFRANDVHLTLANMYVRDGRFDHALTEYRKVDPWNLSGSAQREYFFNRGYAYFSTGDYANARNDFGQVGNDRVYGASATYYRAYIDYEDDNLEPARQGFLSLQHDRNYSPIIPFYLLHIDFKSKDYQAVVRSGPELLKQASGERRAEILRVTGEAYYHLEDYSEAMRYLETYAAENPSLTREEQYMVGYSAFMTADFDKAVAFLNRVAVGEDDLAQNAAYHIGSASLRTGDKQRAKQAFSLAMNLEADRAVQEEAMFNFAKLEYELGNGMFNQSINTLSRYIGQFPDSPNLDEARQFLLAAYLNSKNYAAAYDAIMRIRNPDNEVKTALQKITYFRGLEYFMAGDYDHAHAMFNQSIDNRFNPRYTALTKFWQAETYYRQKEYTRAVPLYQDFIVLSPKGDIENIMANYNLAYCYFNLKNYRDAQTWFDRFIAAYDRNDAIKADAFNRVGDIAFINKNYSRAIADYDRAISVGTVESDYARYQKAITLGLSAGASEKIAALQRIIDDGRGEYVDDAMYELGATYTKQDQFQQAASTLETFIRKYPDSPYYYDAMSDLALTYQNMGRNTEALNYYKQVVTQNPNSAQAKSALLGIRNIYVDNNDLDGYFAFAARNNIETNISIIERDSLTFSVAERIYLGGDARRALPLMQAYLSQFPNGAYIPNATYYVADGQLQEGNKDAALQGFEQVADMKFNPFTINALLKAGALNYERENYETAAGQYRRVTELATNRNVVSEGLIGYIRSTGHGSDPDQIISAADYVYGSAFANEVAKNEADYLRGKAYLSKGNLEMALDNFTRAAVNVKTDHGAEAAFRVIELLADSGRKEEAEAKIFELSDSNPSGQYWLGRAFLLLGDLYLEKGDDFQAKATFQSIVDGYSIPDDGIIESAAEKLTTLK